MTDVEMLVLVILSTQSGRDPARLAEKLELRERKVQGAWTVLQDRDLIAPVEQPEPDGLPEMIVTPAGRALATDALMAVEVAGFQPGLLESLRKHERKAPFRPRGPADP